MRDVRRRIEKLERAAARAGGSDWQQRVAAWKERAEAWLERGLDLADLPLEPYDEQWEARIEKALRQVREMDEPCKWQPEV